MRLLIRGTQLSLELIAGGQEPAELVRYLAEGHERLRRPHRHQLGYRMAVNGDAQSLAAFHPTQELGGAVPKVSLRDVRSHWATA